MTKPITPNEVVSLKTEWLPDAVFAVFNEAIAKHWDGREATFRQDEVAALIAERTATRLEVVYENRWLDVEESYRAVGWSVSYDKPAYCETYPATFTFKKKKRAR